MLMFFWEIQRRPDPYTFLDIMIRSFVIVFIIAVGSRTGWSCSEVFQTGLSIRQHFQDDIEHSVGVKDKCDITQYEQLTSDMCRRW